MVFSATFNNISVILWQSVLLVEESLRKTEKIADLWQSVLLVEVIGVHRENH
jgi:hypothetical protein